MTWTNGLFVHWPFDPDQLRPHIPPPLELDVFDGYSWVSILPFVLSQSGIRFSPSSLRLTFPELNFRTYVSFDGTPGLYFFSIDVDQSLIPAVIGRGTRLPCYDADIDIHTCNDHVRFRCVRNHSNEPPAHFEVSYKPDSGRFYAESGTLDYWLIERRRMYDPVERGVLYADIAHNPWELQSADVAIQANTMFEANGLPTPDGDYRVHYSDRCPMTGSIPRRIHGLQSDSGVRPRSLSQR